MRIYEVSSSLIFFLIFYFSFIDLGFSKKAIWIDYDIAFGKVIRDVDDGLSLIYALNSRSLELKGISHVFGNIHDTSYMKDVTSNILKRYRKENIPFYNGASSSKDLGYPNEAVEKLAEELSKTKLTILAMGRLTNIATLLMLYPEVSKNIQEIIIMGGRREVSHPPIGKNKIIFHDSNIDGDLLAIKKLLVSEVKLTMIPTESMHNIFINKKDIRFLKTSSSNGLWIYRKSWPWRLIWKIFIKTDGFIPFDVFLVSYLTNPEYYRCIKNIPTNLVRMKNDVNVPGRKEARYKNFLLSSFFIKGKKSTYCTEIKDDIKKIILETLSK